MPLVSVIVPNYNHGKYLRKRIDSILNQSFEDFELIILDDNSADESRQIIESYANHPRVSQIVLNEMNSGSTFKQWEKGIAISKGEYIWIAESDDWSDERFLTKMIKMLNENRNTAVAFSQSYLVDGDNKVIGSGKQDVEDVWKNSAYIESKEALKHFVWHTQIINASSVVFRKSHYAMISSKRYSDFKICGDWFFWINLLEHGDLAYESEELNYFRQHSNNVRSRNSLTSLEILEQLEIYNYIKSKYKNLVGKVERKKFVERLKFRLYVKICERLNGNKIVSLHKSITRSLVSFPDLSISLPQLFVGNLIKKFSR